MDPITQAIQAIRSQINGGSFTLSNLATTEKNNLVGAINELASYFPAGILTVGTGRFGNGSAATPSISFINDPDTGWYSGGANILKAATGGVDSIAIGSDGNVGIGTTSPTERLDVSGNIKASGTITAGGNLLVTGSIVYINSQQALTQGVNSLTLGQATYFTTLTYGNGSTLNHKFVAGNVGIGTTTPSARFHAVATTEQVRIGYDASNYISFTVGSTGGVTLSNTGSASVPWIFSGAVKTSGFIEGQEMIAPAAPAANGYRVYAEDDGSGKTRLMVKFATGAAQQIAIEP